jgi:hypothetical protein
LAEYLQKTDPDSVKNRQKWFIFNEVSLESSVADPYLVDFDKSGHIWTIAFKNDPTSTVLDSVKAILTYSIFFGP